MVPGSMSSSYSHSRIHLLRELWSQFDPLASCLLPLPQDVSYILWTGDNAPHDNWRTSREEVLSSTSAITALLRHHFPGVPVLPVIGNHDSAPINR